MLLRYRYSLGRISHEATLVYYAVYTHVSGMFHGCFCPAVHCVMHILNCNVSGMFQRCSLPVLHRVAIYTIHHVSLMFTVMNYVFLELNNNIIVYQFTKIHQQNKLDECIQ